MRADRNRFHAVPYRCADCGTVHPEDVITPAEQTRPLKTVRTICGTRWGGCGDAHEHRHAPGCEDEIAEVA